MNGEYIVGMGRIAVAHTPSVLTSLGLGSCVGVSLYSSSKKVGGLAHIMLPDSHGSGPLSFSKGLVALESAERSGRVADILRSLGFSEVQVAAHGDFSHKFEDFRPDLAIFAVKDVGIDSFQVEQVKQVDKSANVVLIGSFDDTFKASLYNQDILTLEGSSMRDLSFLVKYFAHKNILKYADVAIGFLLEELRTLGVSEGELKAKLCGGARMFNLSSDSDLLRIGENNAEAIRKELNNRSIPIIAEELGGSVGRTMKVDLDTGNISVKTKDGVKTI